MYSYVLGNPLLYTDPDGRHPIVADLQTIQGPSRVYVIVALDRAAIEDLKVEAALAVVGGGLAVARRALKMARGLSSGGRLKRAVFAGQARRRGGSRVASGTSGIVPEELSRAERIGRLRGEKETVEKALQADREWLDNARNLAARYRDAGLEYNPHGLGRELNETIPEFIEEKLKRIQDIESEISSLGKEP